MSKTTTRKHALFDTLIKEGGFKNDAELSRALDVSAPNLCRMRKGDLAIGPTVIIKIMDTQGMSLKRIRALMAG